MTTAQQLETVDRLRTRPFPAERGWSADGAYGGPGFHLADLLVSEKFWEDDGSRRAEAEEQFDAELVALVTLLGRRWGEPEELDLGEHLLRSVEGEPVPEPLSLVCGHVGTLYAWRVGGRRLAVGLGRQGTESPIQLLVLVAAGDPA
ncbi:MAG TPA: hypothetical protein DEQ61_06140 [Streptomyces sp.]|nr:hypothetical protein [Streptomyces sp.]